MKLLALPPKNGTSKRQIFWPEDFLPEYCLDARIMTWGYNSKITNFFSGPTSQDRFYEHAKNLLNAMKRERTNCVSRFQTIVGTVTDVNYLLSQIDL